MERCEALEIPCLIAHPGAHTGAGEQAGLRTIARSLDAIHGRCAGFKVHITLEITAGQGSNLGYRFEHIGNIMDSVKQSDRLRVCFDTQHAFAAGYDIRTREGYERTFTEFDEAIGDQAPRRLPPERFEEGARLPGGPPRDHRQRATSTWSRSAC